VKRVLKLIFIEDLEIMTDSTEKKQKPHLFKPGQSGNPKGRPKGSRNKNLILLEQMIETGYGTVNKLGEET